ncbi:hypothetical protein FOA43_004044 [Brettanomyces nanus]|uniref:AB hydrolase-1 domain-containing protein n=1 Tax=Eeniella nana TaxID=13502 RepID=A0A875SA20_EENNA|nr:uncharacterized protein FOA43_004044 [Brettanomyces nanus]QPG76652.1 hypothetical protein FOA43_004044 [Brettanomyces nanus]
MATTKTAKPDLTKLPGYSGTLKELPVKDSLYTVPGSFKFYFKGNSAEYYEKQLLSNLPFYPEPNENRRAEVVNTPVDDKGNYIHEFYIENTASYDQNGEDPPEIVLIHGYGAALGFFFTNFEGLTSIPGTKLHAIDMLGFGLSSRPNFPRIKADSVDNVKKANGFFIDSLEKWRISRGINAPFVLMAHSLGGYLACAYYLKYGKGKVSKMVMISPVGVERSDLSLLNDSNGTPEQDKSVDEQYRIAREQGVDVKREISGTMMPKEEEQENETTSKAIDDRLSIASDASEDEISSLMTQVRGRVQPGKLLTGMWEKNFSPLQLVRIMGPFAAKLTSIWVGSRFSKVENETQIRQVTDYSTKIFLTKGSGEYGLTRILAPGALARIPLLDVIPKNIDIDTLWLYGQYDWMSKKDGYKICNEINSYTRDKKHGHAKFRIISNAGHHLYVDNRKDFEYQVMKFVRGGETRQHSSMGGSTNFEGSSEPSTIIEPGEFE